MLPVNDPDIHVQCFNDHGIFTLDELNQLSHSVKPQLFALHLNIRSFNQHFDEFKNLLDSVPFSLDFVGCSETFFTSQLNLDCFEILGYELITDNRTFSCGGGVALYVKQGHTFKIRNDLKLPNLENIWIETADLIIGVIYKPSHFSNRDFLDELEETLHQIYLY